MVNADVDIAGARKQVELEEKQQHSQEVLDLQHTPKILSAKVDAVKEENMKLKSENQVQGQYIENFTSSSRFFPISDTKNKEKLRIRLLSVLWKLRLCLYYGMRQMRAGLCCLTGLVRYWGLTQLGPVRMLELVHEAQVWFQEFSVE
ncbi:short coiled-coil protein-like [Mustela lutreola]|uniref:short coiled-coil protein-like n=1 Tax=Mustela lutreola TaxID=9666 RepID=UPI002797A543|nr:short coiled-coil protein-like [Mustela lutreola]